MNYFLVYDISLNIVVVFVVEVAHVCVEKCFAIVLPFFTSCAPPNEGE